MNMRKRLRIRAVLVVCLAAILPAARSRAVDSLTEATQLDAGFHDLYELRFTEARAEFAAWERAHPEDPLGPASEAASYLFEEFYAQGVLSSEFFLDDKRFLGGIQGKPNAQRGAAFKAAVARAQELSKRLLRTSARDAGALFALTIATGMLADYASLIEKRQLECLHYIREAERHAQALLAVRPDAADAYLALGAANYIIGCLPAHTRFFLWFGGIHGDKRGGMDQLQTSASRGHYLRPFAKTLLALAALREKQYTLARTNFQELAAEFPQNPIFSRELAKLNGSAPGVVSSH